VLEKSDRDGMAVIFPPPPEEKLFDFILQSNQIEHCDLTFDDVQLTLQKKAIQPYAAGHLMAIDYIISKLSSQVAWPVKHPAEYATEGDADRSLYWLREIHNRLMNPIARFPEFLLSAQEAEIIDIKECGLYRNFHRKMINGKSGQDRYMPKPSGLKRLLHWWLQQLGTFHLKNLKRFACNPSIVEATSYDRMAYKLHLQLACIHPFTDGTGRSARLIENALRLRWGLPWKTIQFKDRMRYIQDIVTYEDSTEWQTILHSLKAHPLDPA